jgi:hypothetical protein
MLPGSIFHQLGQGDYYHRLLAVGEQDEIELAEAYLKENSLTALYDAVLIPAMSAAETDTRLGALEDEQLNDHSRAISVQKSAHQIS